MNASTPGEDLIIIYCIVLDIITFNMLAIVRQHDYGETDINKPEAEGFYIKEFTAVHYSIL